MTTTESDIAWAAGLYEGEGSVSYGKSRSAHMCISMVDRGPVEKFHRIVGRGYLRGPYDNGPGRQPFWRWSLNRREEVLEVMDLLEPWLFERRVEQFRVVREDLLVRKPRPKYVTYLKDSNQWRAYLPRDGKGYRSLGTFGSEQEALNAVTAARG